jgi:hypothetical protein
LREVNVDAVIVDQHALHLEVGTLTVFLCGKLDECILQTVTRCFVADHFTRQDLAKA